MQDIVKTFTPTEWGLLFIAFIAFVLAWMAWRRAGLAIRMIKNQPVVEKVINEEPAPTGQHRPTVALDITAEKNEFDQVSLVISNTGLLAARQVKLSIGEPDNIYNAENLGNGIEAANVTTNSAIRPRLAVLDAENKLPVSDISSGKSVELPAALTMAHGKICDFPVTLRWKDENGASHQNTLTLTV